MSYYVNDEFMKVINEILLDYTSTCNVNTFGGQIIITDDMANTYNELRGDLVENGSRDLSDIQEFHGLTVQPKELNGEFTIVLNKDYILKSINKHNVDWIGTLVHEAVHVNDFKDYFDLILPKSFDELYDYNQHRIFLYWTEFHARAIGHYFLRKYTLENFRDDVHLDNLLKFELPYQMEYMVKEVSATQNRDRQMYVIVHFLGRVAIWQHLYPDVFNSNFMEGLFRNNPWMEELYNFLIRYDKLEDIYICFNEMENILDKHWG